jgi:hypothetical protein
MTAVIAAGGLAVIGLGTAAATGELSPGAKHAFSDWENINPRDAFLIGELPGPAGTTVAAYEAPDHSNGQTCIAFVARHNPLYQGRSVGGVCANGLGHDHVLGSGGSVSQIELPDHSQFAIFAYSAGNATHADLRYDDASHDVVVANGYILGWVPQTAWPSATLIARDALGAEVGEVRNLGDDEPQTTP